MLAVIAAAMMTLAACGGGEDPDTAITDPTPTETDTDTGGGIAALTDADCQQYAQAFQDVPNVADPSSLESIGELADVLDDAADRVPNEISDDFRVLADAYREFTNALGDSDIDFSDPESAAAMGPEDIAALQAAGEAFSSEELQTATQNIQAFLTENCT
ncbi:MAG: hypothetical protein WD250_04755 [Egibacteraceae bacterium]